MVEIKLNESLIHSSEIKGFFSSERNMNFKLKRLINKNQIKKIKNGLYAVVNPISEDIFATRYEISTSLFENACVAYHSALEFYGLSNQMLSYVYVITDKRNITFYYDKLEYKFFQSNVKSGIIEYERNSKVRVTNLERTLIDCVDRIYLAGGLEELVTAIINISFLDERKLLKYLNEYNKKFLFKKVGFLLSKFNSELVSNNFLKVCLSKISNKKDFLLENKKTKRKFDSYWKIYYPDKIINTEY